MKLIVGLGNPGILYSGSRHNIGFQVIKYLAKSEKIVLKKEKGIPALSAKAKIDGLDVVLAMPLTFMNLSGQAASALLKKYRAGLDELLVVCDDLDLEFGRLKIRSSGSSAGQRGVKSIIDSFDNFEFSRLRIGIGRPQGNLDAATYVLSHFNKKEKSQLQEIIHRAAECCRAWASEGVEKSMNIFNGKVNIKRS